MSFNEATQKWEMEHMEGKCDVCGEMMRFDFDPNKEFCDFTYTEDGRREIWVRHIEGKQPGCNYYMSKVTEAKEVIDAQ